MNFKILALLFVLIVLSSFTSAVTVENGNFIITCTPDEATTQSNGFIQTCTYTNKASVYVELEVLYCLNTKLYNGEISFEENILNITEGGLFGIGGSREIIGKELKDNKFYSSVTEVEKYVTQEVPILDSKGKPIKDKDGKELKENKTIKIKEKEVVDSPNFKKVKDIPVDKKINVDSLKPYCYSAGNVTLEGKETRSVFYNYNPIELDKVKWDTYIMKDEKIVYGLDPQFNAEIYEIGGSRSEYYYWINGTTLNADIKDFSPGLYISQNNITNLANRTNYSFLESKEIGLTNYIRNLRINSTFFGDVSLNVTANNGTDWFYFDSANLSDSTTVYNLTEPVSDNGVLKYFIELHRWVDSGLVVNNSGGTILYTYFNYTPTPPTVASDWRKDGESLAFINLGFNENGSFVDYSTYNYTVVAGT